MWGPTSKTDERPYRRLADESAARAKRMKAESADMPRKLEIMRRVKASELTLKAAQSSLSNVVVNHAQLPNADKELHALPISGSLSNHATFLIYFSVIKCFGLIMNLFTSAKSVAPSKKKAEKEVIEIQNLAHLAEIDAAIKALSALKESYEHGVKERALDHFASFAKKPENCDGVDPDDSTATASVQLRKRASNSPLKDSEVEYLATLGITPDVNVVIPKMFCINPAFAADMNLLEKVSAALDGIVPEGFIVVQEEVSKNISSDRVIDEAYAAKDKEAIRIATTIAIKPKVSEISVSSVLERLAGLV